MVDRDEKTLNCRVCTEPKGRLITEQRVMTPGPCEHAADLDLHTFYTLEGGVTFYYNLESLTWERRKPRNEEGYPGHVFVCSRCENDRGRLLQTILGGMEKEALETKLELLSRSKRDFHEVMTGIMTDIKEVEVETNRVETKLSSIR